MAIYRKTTSFTSHLKVLLKYAINLKKTIARHPVHYDDNKDLEIM